VLSLAVLEGYLDLFVALCFQKLFHKKI